MNVSITAWSAWESGEEHSGLPELSFLPSRMKRRMSQLSRMIVEIGHRLIGENPVNDVIFASRYGELNRQLEITEGILDKGEVSPASFSQSVFNTPVALVSLHEKITGVTRAVYAGADSFPMGLLQAMLLASEPGSGRILYLYGDERIPETYSELVASPREPLALGLMLEAESDRSVSLARIGLDAAADAGGDPDDSARRFRYWLEDCETGPLSFGSAGCGFVARKGEG